MPTPPVVHGADELLKELETLEVKGRQWLPLVTGVPRKESVSLVERESYFHHSKLLNLSAHYGKTWDLTLQNRVKVVYHELDRGVFALRKGRIDDAKTHIETALEDTKSLIMFLKSQSTKS